LELAAGQRGGQGAKDAGGSGPPGGAAPGGAGGAALQGAGRGSASGMVLPFRPLAMTFRDVNYYVDMPKVLPCLFLPGAAPCSASCVSWHLVTSSLPHVCANAGQHVSMFGCRWLGCSAFHKLRCHRLVFSQDRCNSSATGHYKHPMRFLPPGAATQQEFPSCLQGMGTDTSEKRLQLLRGCSGSFRPGVLTALVGVSGAGKTTCAAPCPCRGSFPAALPSPWQVAAVGVGQSSAA